MNSYYKTTNILILGKGYIGNYLVNHLKNNRSYKIDHLSKSAVDYTDPSKLKDFLNFLKKN